MTAEKPPEAPRRPRIVIEFAGPDLASCTVIPDSDVTIGQVYEAAFLLDMWARETRAGAAAAAAQQQLVRGIPGGDLAALLRRQS